MQFFIKLFDKECYYLIKLSECERYVNEYIDEEIFRYYNHVPDSAKIVNITQELEYRVAVTQCIKHTSPEVEHEKEYRVNAKMQFGPKLQSERLQPQGKWSA